MQGYIGFQAIKFDGSAIPERLESFPNGFHLLALFVTLCSHLSRRLFPVISNPVINMIRSCLSLLALAAVAMAGPRQPSSPAPSPPDLTYLFSLNITSGPPINIGTTPLGDRVFEPIVGGSFSGPKLSGRFHIRN